MSEVSGADSDSASDPFYSFFDPSHGRAGGFNQPISPLRGGFGPGAGPRAQSSPGRLPMNKSDNAFGATHWGVEGPYMGDVDAGVDMGETAAPLGRGKGLKQVRSESDTPRNLSFAPVQATQLSPLSLSPLSLSLTLPLYTH